MNLCAGNVTSSIAGFQPARGGANPTPALQLTISPCEFTSIREFVETWHYSKNTNGVKITQCFRVDSESLVGGVIFGALSTTAWKRFANSESKVIELRRFVLLDSAGKNSESRVLGWCLRWIKKHLPIIEVIVSYADPAYGHSGVIYRAANFQYEGVGTKDKGFKDPENGKIYHSRALRTRGNDGDFKPFVKRLRAKQQAGLLSVVELPGKHCYTYRFKNRVRSA